MCHCEESRTLAHPRVASLAALRKFTAWEVLRITLSFEIAAPACGLIRNDKLGLRVSQTAQ